ncbi:MAG: bacillithiol biosynthesis cysteine-adding enzyme BshC [Acidobacteriales bacterium]|nr:bacillithiol biosynthesis cysteine-adding enzyme BshC [Terriglobales bacterium]
MSSTCIPYTALTAPSALYADFLSDFANVARFYDYPPCAAESYARAAAVIDYPDERRAALVAALERRNGANPALTALARPGTVVVTTGQQVGLFSGPAYTIYKALTAAKLVRRLTENGIPAVAVFWLATEDHDFEEVRSCWVFDHEQRPKCLEVVPDSTAPRVVGSIPVAGDPAAGLAEALGELPFAKEVAALVSDAYRDGRPFGDAFAALLAALLPGYDLLLLDPLDPAIRALAAPMLARAVEVAPELLAALARRGGELTAAGYHAQVHVEADHAPFFLLDGGRRLALRREGDVYASRDARYTTSDLGDLAARLSPNALLRPVVADYLMPTVATVLGPAETAYMAQSQVLYHALLGRTPVMVPRAGFTVLDARAAKLMARYGLELNDVLEGEEALAAKIASRLVPPALDRSLAAAEQETTEVLDRLRPGVGAFDATLGAALEKSRAKILYQLAKIRRKTARESARRDQRAAGETVHLANLVYPHRHLQERFYSILPFLARHGLDLIGRLYENVQVDRPDHRILMA